MFSELIEHPRLLVGLEKQGISAPTDIQSEAIPQILEGKDVLACAETGSGKTLAYALPLMQRLLSKSAPGSATRALVMAPTRELAAQIQKVFSQYCDLCGMSSGLITGGAEFKYQASLLRKNPEILVVTPGRLVDHLKRGTCDLADLECLILDEADRMLDMGFSDDMAVVTSACAPNRQTLMFSATLKHKGVERIAADLLNQPISITTRSIKEQHALIRQQQLLADDIPHKERLLIWLLANETYDKAIVFANKRVEVDRLLDVVRRHREGVAILHGELTQDERKYIIQQVREGRRNILIATDVAARGLDIEGIDLVINFDMARKGDEYVHRIGRTGRAGKEGKAINLILPSEWNLKASIERYLEVAFEKRQIEGLIGNYRGPKKLKSSGKAAGTKKKKTKTGQRPANRCRTQASTSQTRKPGSGSRAGAGNSPYGRAGSTTRQRSNLMDSEGNAPIRKKRTSEDG